MAVACYMAYGWMPGKAGKPSLLIWFHNRIQFIAYLRSGDKCKCIRSFVVSIRLYSLTLCTEAHLDSADDGNCCWVCISKRITSTIHTLAWIAIPKWNSICRMKALYMAKERVRGVQQHKQLPIPYSCTDFGLLPIDGSRCTTQSTTIYWKKETPK